MRHDHMMVPEAGIMVRYSATLLYLQLNKRENPRKAAFLGQHKPVSHLSSSPSVHVRVSRGSRMSELILQTSLFYGNMWCGCFLQSAGVVTLLEASLWSPQKC
jgi:hypothetical protein